MKRAMKRIERAVMRIRLMSRLSRGFMYITKGEVELTEKNTISPSGVDLEVSAYRGLGPNPTFSQVGPGLRVDLEVSAYRGLGPNPTFSQVGPEIKAANGVVIATEKKLPSILVDETSVQKIQILTPNIGVVYSGMGPDSRVLVRKSRKQAEQYYRLYKEPIPVTQLVRETATVMQEFTQSGGVRPFGVSLLVAGYDDKGPQLYQVDPSGSYFSWKASAMGKNVSNAKTFLEKRYTEDMELDDAVHTAILTLKEGFEGQISGKNIEIGVIGNDKIFRVLTSSEIEDYLQEVE
ncbi:Proteasome subunit alpha type-2-A [Sesamum angolense]|uniref:Proteasome subunit alpha type-2-A n=1 Tax=Sesamum angolense TaxID=2727404 RepID=A0AAE2BPH1_9LAMI|nr:Proteasome subunit alpha type-2-A [Sesamum angolense]